MHIPLLPDIVIILGLSVLVILGFQKVKLPTILGFLLTGIIAGPYGLGLISAYHEVEILAEIGVILLLFIIGLEFSLKSLSAIKKTVFIGGTFQVGVTILAFLGAALLLGYEVTSAVFIGFLFSLSSTAIVLKILQSKGEITSPHGKIALAILIFQDIIVVPMMLVTPIMAGEGDDLFTTIALLLGKTLFVVVLVILAARYIFPRLLFEVTKTRSRELFILTIMVSCFAIAWLTSSIGLSLALGAFIAGLIISESEYSHQATSHVLPFREIFTSFFFVSIGMLLDLSFLWEHLVMIIGLTIIVSLVKGAIATGAAFILRYPPKTAFLSGLALFQVGEFAFILSKVGIEYNMVDETVYQYFLSVSILTMGITPILLLYSDRIANLLDRTTLSKNLAKFNYWERGGAEEENLELLEDHLIIIGFGVNGRNVARAAKSAKIPYVIIEMNPATVKEEKAKGEPIIYGDASDPFILELVKVYKARVAVVAISDTPVSKKVVQTIRDICKTVYVIIRSRFIKEIDENLRLGADEVIPEEFETSVEIFTRVLNKYLVPQEQIEDFVQLVRADNYKMFRPRNKGSFMNLNIPNMRITCLTVQHSSNDIVGKTLEESNIREKYGINLLAIQRSGEFLVDLNRSSVIKEDDLLYMMGSNESITNLREQIHLE